MLLCSYAIVGVALFLVQTEIDITRELATCYRSSSSSPASAQGDCVLFAATHLHNSIKGSLDQSSQSKKLAKFSGIRLRLNFRRPFGGDWCDRD